MSGPYWIAGLPLTSEAALAEAVRLRKTITLAEEALKIARHHRSAANAPGEEIAETTARWSEAAEIEDAATACRKAARRALAAVAVFPDVWSDAEIRAKIETARAAALDLKAACDAGQEADQRRRMDIAARESGYLSAADKAADAMSGARAMIAEAAAAPDSPAEIKRRAAANKRRLGALKKGGLL